MDDPKYKNSKYFQDALSDFIHDAASGRAIRHLVDAGYTTTQIMKELDYPTPFAKIQRTVTKYLKETGIVLEELPATSADLRLIRLNDMPQDGRFSFLARQTICDGEENSYISCPFGITGGQTAQALSILTAREREYLDGIAWEEKVMYHRLNRRMLEIGAQIAPYTNEIHFFFLKSKLRVGISLPFTEF